jgi:hypothetical protein
MMLLQISCVKVPIPTKENKVLTGIPVTKEQQSFLVPMLTTREEVIARLGNPNIIWEDARVFVYNWDMRQGILLWAIGGYGAGAAGLSDIEKHYLLLIQFDEQGKVQRFDRTTRPLMQSHSIFLEEWLKKSPAYPPAGQNNQGEVPP